MSETTTRLDEARSPVPRGAGDGADTTVTDRLAIASAWTSALLERIRCNAELTIAEAKLAASSFMLMLFLAVVAAVLTLTAWGVMLAGATLGLQSLGVPVAVSLAAIGLTHLIAAVLVFQKIRRLSQALDLPETKSALSAGGRSS